LTSYTPSPKALLSVLPLSRGRATIKEYEMLKVCYNSKGLRAPLNERVAEMTGEGEFRVNLPPLTRRPGCSSIRETFKEFFEMLKFCYNRKGFKSNGLVL
jgi:hypothetical protein